MQNVFLRMIPMAEAATHVAAGQASWRRDGSGRVTGCRLTMLLRAGKDSPTSITVQDMRAFVGEFGGARMCEAQRKVDGFAVALPSDMQAVKAWPRHTVLLKGAQAWGAAR